MPIGNALSVIRSKPLSVKSTELNTLSVFAGDGQPVVSGNITTFVFNQGNGGTSSHIPRPEQLYFDKTTNLIYFRAYTNNGTQQAITTLYLNSKVQTSSNIYNSFYIKNSILCTYKYFNALSEQTRMNGITYVQPLVNNTYVHLGGGFAIDSNGICYTTGIDYKIYKGELDGTLSVFAGTSKGFLDGNVSVARINNVVRSMIFDTNDNLYFVDGYCIRKLDTNGNITTIAGNYNTQGDVDGDSSTSRFNTIKQITFDNYDNLFVLDTKTTGTNLFRKIKQVSSDGIVTTFKTLSTSILGEYTDPYGICFDCHGYLYVSDYYYNRIWRYFKS